MCLSMVLWSRLKAGPVCTSLGSWVHAFDRFLQSMNGKFGMEFRAFLRVTS